MAKIENQADVRCGWVHPAKGTSIYPGPGYWSKILFKAVYVAGISSGRSLSAFDGCF